MHTTLSDTRLRATLRGRESVARWRVEGASWVGWLYATASVLNVLGGFVGAYLGVRGVSPGATIATGVVTAAIAAAMAFGIFRMRRGSRGAAVAVVGVSALGVLLSWPPGFLDLAVLFVLANGAWGTFQLAAVREDSAGVPPAPEPRARFGRAFS